MLEQLVRDGSYSQVKDFLDHQSNTSRDELANCLSAAAMRDDLAIAALLLDHAPLTGKCSIGCGVLSALESEEETGHAVRADQVLWQGRSIEVCRSAEALEKVCK